MKKDTRIVCGCFFAGNFISASFPLILNRRQGMIYFMKIKVIILAGGKGTRMQSNTISN
jgi:hypothetical protein